MALIHLFFGLLLAWLIPLLIHKFRLIQPGIKKPGAALAYGLMVLWDIVIANLQVIRLVLGPNKKLRPAFVLVPLAEIAPHRASEQALAAVPAMVPPVPKTTTF